MFRSKSLAGTVERPAVMGSVGTDDKFVMMDRVEDQLWELWIRVQWGMAYGMGQWMARCCGSGSSGAWPMGWVSGWQGARWLSARAHVGVCSVVQCFC